ncbi:hypothetical protein AAC387_Pa07g2365 [Persea americana]
MQSNLSGPISGTMPEERESDHEQAEGEQAGEQNVEIGDEDTTSIQGSENEAMEDDDLILDEISEVPASSNSLPAQKKIRRHIVFNSTMDDEMLGFLMEQIDMGQRGDRGFEVEAYTSVANSMNAAHGEKYLFTVDTIKNRCKKLKADYASVTEMLNAYGFGYDNSTHRIVADDEVWIGWLRGHPKANTWRSRTIDYDKLSMVFGRDSATGRFARSSVDATTPNIDADG